MIYVERLPLISSIASTVQRSILAAEQTQLGTVPTYKESIQIPPQYVAGSILRVSVEIKSSAGGSNGLVDIYSGIVGAPYVVGLSNSTVNYTEVTFDISLYFASDTIQLWLYAAAAGTTGYARNFRILCTDRALSTSAWP